MRKARLWGSEWMIIWKEKMKTVRMLVFEQHKAWEELKTMSIYWLHIRWTADQSLPAPPCPAAGVHWRPTKSLKESEVDPIRLKDSSSSRNSGKIWRIEETFPIWLQQWMDPESQLWLRADMVGTATTAEMKVTNESDLKYIVVMLRETEKRMK